VLLHLVGAEQLGAQGRIIGENAVGKAVPAQPRYPLSQISPDGPAHRHHLSHTPDQTRPPIRPLARK